MLKTILMFPDGTEISSGAGQKNAITTTSIEETVNDAEDLTFGSVCAKMIEVSIITPQNEFRCEANDEITVYQKNESGEVRKKGIFIAEKPQKVNSNTTKINAFDNIIKLDIDLTEWLQTLDEFPYSLYAFAQMVCARCGLVLANESIFNGDMLVHEFAASGITGRQIMSWICEAAGSYCVANSNGEIEISWYSKNSKKISAKTEDGAVSYFGGSLSYEDYSVSLVDAVQIKKDSKDVGVIYPTDSTNENVYIIENNPLISVIDNDAITAVAQKLYNRISAISYTPCKVSVPSSFYFSAGDIISITDANDKTITAYIMSKTRKGQKDELVCTGNFKRNGASVVYNTSYKSLFGKTLSIEKSVDALTITAKESESKISKLEQTAGQVSVEIQDESGKVVSIINPNQVKIAKENANGDIISGFFYDTDAGEFKYYGSGEFRSADEDGAFIRIENDEIVLYAKNGYDKVHIGYISNEETDFPYILLGAEGFEGYVGLIKQFANGIWFGNSIVKQDTGDFASKSGASGLFINTQENKAYIVAGTEMQNLYTGEAIARFA